MEITTIAQVRAAFYRVVGSTSDDDGLVENGETAGDVALLCLTRGFRAAQRWMIAKGMAGRWRKRSDALTWTGTDATLGGRYSALPSDFLRLAGQDRPGKRKRGAIVEANGDPWGWEATADEDHLEGDYYYLKNDQLWIARRASPPATVYFDYHYEHPALTATTTEFDLPSDAIWLGIYEAADVARAESWFPLTGEQDLKIMQALDRARRDAKDIARQSRQPAQFKRPTRYGTRW